MDIYDIRIFGLPNASEIVKGKIFIGNLTGAASQDLREELKITHILSVCDNYPSTGPNHLVIPIDDKPSVDILIHLCKTCQFIEEALQQGGRVLVHCAAGISRSPTVVAAYLMKTRKIGHFAAIRFIRDRRSQILPNCGFSKQLDVFGQCEYDPKSHCAPYANWRRLRFTTACGGGGSSAVILYAELYASINSKVPENRHSAIKFIQKSSITHILSFSPSQISSAIDDIWRVGLDRKLNHINISQNGNELEHLHEILLVALPEACKFICKAIEDGGRVLVHSPVESTATIVLCAFLMSTRKIPPQSAYKFLTNAFPFAELPPTYIRFLEVFEACGYEPTLEHPLVKELMMMASESNSESDSEVLIL